MRKKYLSALLFGALLFASTGTFTSCKDYDDDINNLQTQIDGVVADIEDLQAQISAGKWIESVTAISGGFTVTFSDGQSFNIVNGQDGAAGAPGQDGAAGAPGTQITIGEDGYWYFDGVKSDYLAVANEEDGKINVPTIQNGVWYIVNEDGELEATEYKANGATYAVAEANGGFTIYAPNEDGTGMVECYFPGAAGSITEMTLGGTTRQPQAATLYSLATWNANGEDGYSQVTNASQIADTDVLVSREKFTFNNNRISEVPNANAWMGNKKLPNNGDWVYSSPTSIDLRIDPVNVPAEDIDFTLTNTLNQNLQPFTFAATPSQTSGTPMNGNQVNSRATTGNGLWTLKMQNVVVSGNSGTWGTINSAESNGYVYAVNADNAFRSKYELTVQRVKPETLTTLSIWGVDATSESSKEYTIGVNERGFENTKDAQNVTFKTGVNYQVNGMGVQSSALYDMYLTADASDVEVYGLTFDQDNHTFRIGKNPDVSTIPANFDLTVYTVANDGTVNKAEIQVQINTEINAPAEYSLIEHNVNTTHNKNYFGIDLATMKAALGGNLNQWIQNVDLRDAAVEMEWSADGSHFSNTIPAGIDINVVSQLLDKNNPNYNPNADDNRNAANFIQVDINNSDVNGLELDHTYYIRATFKTTGGETLNSITVPVEFHAPKLADLFAIRDAYVVDNVINAYFYDTTGRTAVDLTRYFSAYVADAEIKFASGNVGETGHNGDWLFEFSQGIFGGKQQPITTLDFDRTVDSNGTNHYGIINGRGVNGYGEAVTVKVTKGYYNTDETATHGWNYTTSGDDTYNFQIRLLSPVYEGTVTPVSGDAVTINANDFVQGARITEEDIIGRDYANNDFYMFQGNLTTRWRNAQIANVVPGIDDEHYIDNSRWVSVTTQDANGNTVTAQQGYIRIQGRSISNTTTVNLPVSVTDAWGLVLNTEVPVTITVGESAE